jgi:peptidoglycan/LPS O-acetylase OafA/YrhL
MIRRGVFEMTEALGRGSRRGDPEPGVVWAWLLGILFVLAGIFWLVGWIWHHAIEPTWRFVIAPSVPLMIVGVFCLVSTLVIVRLCRRWTR